MTREVAREQARVIDRFRLDGRTAIITGASSGLGLATARALAEIGANVVLAARRMDLVVAAAAQLALDGAKAIAVRCDVAVPENCQTTVDTAIRTFGSVDVLVNNAGVSASVPATREIEHDFRRIVDVNLMGTYWMSQACGRAMAPGSAVVNVSSVLALTTAGLPQAAYSASKAALLGLTRDLAQQWRADRRDIRVNAVAPGFFSTSMTAEMDPTFLSDLVRRRVLASRLGEDDECAAAVAFLASPAASYINGTVLMVDGGFSVT